MALPEHASYGERLWHRARLAICIAVLAFLVVPILVIVPLSFSADSYFTFSAEMLRLSPEGWSLRWYDQLLTLGMVHPDRPRDLAWWADAWRHARWLVAARNSFLIGVPAAALASILGTLAALGMARAEMPWRRGVMALILAPIIVPPVVTAAGMFLFYSNPCAVLDQVGLPGDCGRLTGSWAGMVLAHAVLGVPFVVVTVTATLAGFDRRLAQAAAGLGARPWVVFRRITLPLILPGIAAGALFAFAISFDEVVVALFIAGPDQQTIPLQMWNGVRDRVSPAILAMAVLLVALSLVFLAAFELLRRRGERLNVRRDNGPRVHH